MRSVSHFTVLSSKMCFSRDVRWRRMENERRELGSPLWHPWVTAGCELRLWASQLDPSGRNTVWMTSKEKTHVAQSWELSQSLFHTDESSAWWWWVLVWQGSLPEPCLCFWRKEGIGMRSSAMGRSVASVAAAAEISVCSCRGWRCYKVNPETTVILVFKLVHFWNIYFPWDVLPQRSSMCNLPWINKFHGMLSQK